MENKQLPLVSIITPVYNTEKYIGETIDSVIKQTYQNWEMIIVDDLSTDNSVELISKICEQEAKIRLIQLEKNGGSGIARNRAISEARGKYIAFLDSDDIWLPQKLEVQIHLMEDNDWALSHSSFGYINEDGGEIRETYHVSKFPVSYKQLLKRTEIGCLTAVYNSQKLGKVYMSEHRRKQDYALWLKILKKGYLSHGIDQKLALYRQRTGAATSKKYKLIIKHYSFLKETQGFSSFQAIYYTFHWMINGLLKYYS